MLRPRRNRVSLDAIPWRKRLQALRNVPRFLKLIWETHSGYTLAILFLRAVRALVPIATLWVGKLIIDEVILLASDSSLSMTDLWTYVGIELAVVLLGDIVGRLSTLFESLLGDLFSNETSVRMIRHAAELDLSRFEDAEFYDKMERARRQTVNRIALLSQLLNIAQSGATLVSLAAAILVYNPWLFLLLFGAVLPSFLGQTRYASLEYSLLYQWTPQRRLLDYYRFIGASQQTAREIKSFGLKSWISRRYRELADEYYQENKRLSKRRALVSSLLVIFSEAGYYFAYVLIILDTVSGAITVGTLTFLSGSFMQARNRFESIFNEATRVQQGSLYLKDLFDFFEVQPTVTNVASPRPIPRPIQHGVTFEDVSFRYPGTDLWALRGLSLHFAPGERIALVGENGAGKTTLVKLISRLYDPTEGRILIDGVDLREYDIEDVRANIGIIFQDFVRYDLRLVENVGLGDISRTTDVLDEGRNDEEVWNDLESAADKSLASSLVDSLAGGWDQMLGRRFESGVELSGGEWQKIALARAHLRDAQILILDEPTAALDARAEYEVFLRFSELVRDRLAIIISHRFSTVRMADTIFVLRQGQLQESGSHQELLQQGGLYAELFNMQAEGYRT